MSVEKPMIIRLTMTVKLAAVGKVLVKKADSLKTLVFNPFLED